MYITNCNDDLPVITNTSAATRLFDNVDAYVYAVQGVSLKSDRVFKGTSTAKNLTLYL